MFVDGMDARLASSYAMRTSDYVRKVAKFYVERDGSAEQKIGWALGVIDIWVNAGGTLRNPRGSILDVLGKTSGLDGYVHTIDDTPVFKELHHFRLQDPAMAFKEDGRRTMNRFLCKSQMPGKSLLDQRLLPMVIWLALAMSIHQERLQSIQPD